ncbi:MAG: hypothetical protein ACYTF9_00560 [Planctomycetota bacterium]
MTLIGRLHSNRLPAARRGNSIVLVAAILALLAIIATAYVSRTQTERITGRAVRQASQRDIGARRVGDDLANLIAMHVFPRPLGFVANGTVVDSNTLRFSPRADRFGTDGDFNNDGLADNAYNFAPHAVVPWTNWPDAGFGGFNTVPQQANLPRGAGNPTGGAGGLVIGDSNPLGNPGYGDTRWLADFEPMRSSTTVNGNINFPDTFSHWRHLSYIGTPENGYRIATDISDVFDSNNDGLGRILMDLNVPVEQWLAYEPMLNPTQTFIAASNLNFNNGEIQFSLIADPSQGFPTSMATRMGQRYFEFADSQTSSMDRTPPNFLNLSDLNGNGFNGEPGERPQDEFNLNTLRGQASRFLADAEIRQLVAVRIVDNSAMLNFNVATQFVPNDAGNLSGDPLFNERTLGQTPADLALVGQGIDLDSVGTGNPPNDQWNVGFFDTPLNDNRFWVPGPFSYAGTAVGYDVTNWYDAGTDTFPFLAKIGAVIDHHGFADSVFTQGGRRHYWRSSGLRPFAPADGLTPFGLADELELRAYAGQNNPWIASPFEQAMQKNVFDQAGKQFLRANQFREETSEYLDQLNARGLRYDHRRRLTVHSGARNDEMPPWLRWRWENPLGFATQEEIENFIAQTRRKLDLREKHESYSEFLPGEYSLRFRLAGSLMLALTDSPAVPGGLQWGSYFGDITLGDITAGVTGDDDNPAENCRRMAAGLAANIVQRRDPDAVTFLSEAVPMPMFGNTTIAPIDYSVRAMGMEAQPFLVEAFVGHAHQAVQAPLDDGLDNGNDPYANGGNYVIMKGGEAAEPSSIVVVQIANPFDFAINLKDYRLRIFDQIFPLQDPDQPEGDRWLAPAIDEVPVTATFYAIKSDVGGDALAAKWLDFLDLEPADLPTNSIVAPMSTISTDPLQYESVDGENETIALEHLRYTDETLTNSQFVEIDRIDRPDADPAERMATRVASLDQLSTNILQYPPTPPDANPDGTTEWPINSYAFDLGPQAEGFSHWVEWARVTRAWGADVDNDLQLTDLDRNPRFVFAYNKITSSAVEGAVGTNFVESTGGQKYRFSEEPDLSGPGDVIPSEGWFSVPYETATGVSGVQRKPTFFDMNRGSQQTIAFLADKGWYGEGDDLDFAMQMLQKDADFIHVGEVMNVWTFGHEMEFAGDPTTADYQATRRTFSEFLATPALVGVQLPSVGRMMPIPVDVSIDGGGNAELGQIVGRPDETLINPDILDVRHAIPEAPAALRVLDLFVCDGPGLFPGDFNNDGNIEPYNPFPQPGSDLYLWGLQAYENAGGFERRMTPGMINLNTAPAEVMRALPHWNRMVNENLGVYQSNPRVGLPEAVVQYRERFDGAATGQRGGPNYWDNNVPNSELPTLNSRGINSVGEILMMREDIGVVPLFMPNAIGAAGTTLAPQGWRADYAARDPFSGTAPSHLSTDDIGGWSYDIPTDSVTYGSDRVAGDVEEENMLFNGVSNLVTTRSDVFTVYYRIRTFRRNAQTGVWNALDADNVLDDTRYVMLVDRSEVERTTDKPKILYQEKIPN